MRWIGWRTRIQVERTSLFRHQIVRKYRVKFIYFNTFFGYDIIYIVPALNCGNAFVCEDAKAIRISHLKDIILKASN